MAQKNFPKITIVTPSFNQGRYLERTIQSVLSQHYPNLEYIVIDGGSTDSSKAILQKYKKHFSYLRIHNDHGQADAIQKGFARSTGEILAWLNSDDVLLPGALHFVAKVFRTFRAIEWLTGQPVSINENDQIVQTGLHTGKLRPLIRAGWYHGKGLGFIGQEGTFWRRSLWEKAGATVEPHHYALDYFLWKKFARFAPLVSAETPLAAFRIHRGQKTEDLRPYYTEINPLLALVPHSITLVARLLHPLLLRRICPRLFFDKKKYRWVFNKGKHENRFLS